MTRLYLHAGLPKTGTTSLQVWMHANRDKLRAQGLFVPETGQRERGKHQFALKPLLQEGLMSMFLEQITPEECHRVFLSHEGMSNHLYDMPAAATRAFREATKQLEKVAILVVRDKEAWLRSYYRQCVINPLNNASDLWGTSRPLCEIRTHPRVLALMNHAKLAIDLGDTLGADRTVTLRREDPRYTAQLAAVLDLPPNPLPELPRLNTHIPDWVVEFLRHVNEATPEEGDRLIWKRRLQSYFDNPAMVFTHSTAASTKLEAGIADARLLERYTPDESKAEYDAFAEFVLTGVNAR